MTHDDGPQLTIGQCASLACLWEVTAPKPGNVHRGADFDDVTFEDFVTSSIAIAPVMNAAIKVGVGRTVLSAIEATRSLVSTNTNLGIVLLLAPLACVPRDTPLTSGLHNVLTSLTDDDARHVYQAIHLSGAGGLGQVDEMDVADDVPQNLLTAMEAAANRDLVARQYVNRFDDIFTTIVPALVAGVASGWSLSDTIVHTHVRAMATWPDSLIGRKCGGDVARESALRAGHAIMGMEPASQLPTQSYYDSLADLDFWLRMDGHRRNPGTTADLICAGLFCCLRDRLLLSEPR